MDGATYDEFGLFHENLEEWGLHGPVPPVRRFFVAVDGLRQLSGLWWGDGAPELVLVHGSAQNAHTFDTVALALGRPLVALDLPGHGHSDPSPYARPFFRAYAKDLARAIEQVRDEPPVLVGMSLGGLCSILVSANNPNLVRALVLVDITPGVNATKAQHVTDFVNGPATFPDFDALLRRTIEHNPTRSESSLRRGILHNALQREDGTWVWRHQQHVVGQLEAPPVGDLWERLGSVEVPVTLVRAMGPTSVVNDEDEAEFRRRLPRASVVHVANAGHSVQGDQPLILAGVLDAAAAER